ncbi:MAG: restriction endonuclease subunit S, partial [Prevotellaceae bacterium]|nr:restriction endonuclease subunit S [Prevotellaceae bacterium]
ANYLDSVTSKIDEAISQQQKMIDLLNERKQIIIQNAVTKGLDPNAKMKDSGVEWIGEIPENWEVKRIKYIGEAINGLTYSPSDIVNQGNGILVLRSSNIEKGRLVFKDKVYVKKCNPKLYVKKGDIIICSRNGSASLVGKCAIVDNEINASFGAFMMRFRSFNHNKYIYYLLTSAISHYKQLFSTSTINQLTLSIFANIKMPICNYSTQKRIADYLDDITYRIDSSITQCEKMISLLQERKQIIINDVVTGKVKVV